MSNFLRRSLLIFTIKGFRTIVFIFIVISTTFYHYFHKKIIWSLQVQSSLLVNNNTGILNTRTRLWLTESEQATPVDSIKDVVQSSVKGSRVRQTPKEGLRTYRPKRCGNNTEDEDNSPKTLNDKNLIYIVTAN